jgi:hypothetical protein
MCKKYSFDGKLRPRECWVFLFQKVNKTPFHAAQISRQHRGDSVNPTFPMVKEEYGVEKIEKRAIKIWLQITTCTV